MVNIDSQDEPVACSQLLMAARLGRVKWAESKPRWKRRNAEDGLAEPILRV